MKYIITETANVDVTADISNTFSNISDGKNDYRLSFVSEENIVIGSKIYGTKEQSGVKLYNSCEHYFKNKK